MLPSAYPMKEFPWCTVFLVVLCMVCHAGVLYGNNMTALGFEQMGLSSAAWSNVGVSLAKSFRQSIDTPMADTIETLDAAIANIAQLQDLIDEAVSDAGDKTQYLMREGVAGNRQRKRHNPEAAFYQTSQNSSSHREQRKAKAAQPSELRSMGRDIALPSARKFKQFLLNTRKRQSPTDDLPTFVPASVQYIGDILNELLDAFSPTLLLLGDWETRFGDKIQASVDQFGTTIDLVQKLFDQIMAQISPSGGDPEYMRQNTYTLFALTDAEKGISVQDLADASGIYSITAMQGSKGEELFGRYDVNKDALIDINEYAAFAEDGTIPNVMAVVLRAYAKRLAVVSGMVGRARMRDEVAGAVTKYLQLVCAKNITKVGWISQMLTNGTLPLAFTADVMRNLALASDDPEVLTTADVGAVVVGTMASLNQDTTLEAVDLMSNATFWSDEGFDPEDQPICVERVTKWTAASFLQLPTGAKASAFARMHEQLSDHGVGGESAVIKNDTELSLSRMEESTKLIEHFVALGRQKVARSRNVFLEDRRRFLMDRQASLLSTPSSRFLFQTLFGGKMAATFDPSTIAAINGGAVAKPETLEFAHWLSCNASSNAQDFQKASFEYTGESSAAMDSFATLIQGMVKKTQSLLSMMKVYSGEGGIAKLRAKIDDFTQNAEDELNAAIGGASSSLARHAASPRGVALTLRQEPSSGATWDTLLSTLEELAVVLPQVAENLKVARTAVSSVAATLDSVFEVFADMGLPLFLQIASMWRTIWIVYFVLLTLLCLFILYYGFFASGYCGGPKYREQEPERETSLWDMSFCDKLKCCCSACCNCCRDFCEGQFCFWSCLYAGQLFVVLLFILSLVFCIIGGVEAFIGKGCSAINVLNDDDICGNVLVMLNDWVSSFDAGHPELALDDVCGETALTTCKVIEETLTTAAILTVSLSVVGAFFHFQLLIQCAILGEQSRMRRLIDELAKEGKLELEDEDSA
eukprot:TRINITY_DN21589_c0_g1_i1.p1 TRINITY_DN21589_c0_g1~~TRINITY_DN21589_c0_g1_i1.p1  ORF type:complete len:981 (-),score=197.33 TRINITY_DN21589_c0_g1_i1:76-3018(-)